jgi:ubiquinone biosynthesis monooxygenase Coq7
MLDDLVIGFDRALRALSGLAVSARQRPARTSAGGPCARRRRHAAGLMRVNHTGEICAQALYAAQALTARDPAIRQFAAAAREGRSSRLDSATARRAVDRPSWLNPLWYGGAFASHDAGVASDRINLGFVVETERQVEDHLTHIELLPPAVRRAARSSADARRRGTQRHGAIRRRSRLPFPVRYVMRAAAGVMRAVTPRLGRYAGAFAMRAARQAAPRFAFAIASSG